jgi:TRAP-type mannitol/chloroaromatic compound transport system permease small subunit
MGRQTSAVCLPIAMGGANLKKFIRLVDNISKWSGTVTSYLLWPGVVVLTYEIVARYVFNSPTIWAHGVSQRMFAVYYILSGGLVSLTRSHVAMDLIYTKWSPRGKAIADLFTFALVLVFGGILFWESISYAADSLRMLEPDNTPFRAPLYPVKMIVPIGVFILLLQELANAIRNVYIIATGRAYDEH